MKIKITKTHQRYFAYNELCSFVEGDIIDLPSDKALDILKDEMGVIKNEEKMEKTIIENKAILSGFENKTEVAEKDAEEELTLEDYKKIADEKGIEYHHRVGLEKLKNLIKASE